MYTKFLSAVLCCICLTPNIDLPKNEVLVYGIRFAHKFTVEIKTGFNSNRVVGIMLANHFRVNSKANTIYVDCGDRIGVISLKLIEYLNSLPEIKCINY